jgi:RloB-like protein
MSLLNRTPLSIGRAQRSLRDDRVFVVATDDTYAPKQYFEQLALPRVKVFILPTPEGSGHSSPSHVVERLRSGFAIVRGKGEVQTGDEFWVLLDTDHHIRDSNLSGTLDALRLARQAGFEIALSNPCFELWLLLHHADVPVGTVFPVCSEVEKRLRAALGEYNKTSVKAGHFPVARVPDAIRRARALESSPDDPVGHWPEQAGTRVYRLLERALPPVQP